MHTSTDTTTPSATATPTPKSDFHLSERLRQVRSDHGLTQAEIAAELFVTRQTVTRWESGAHTPPLTALEDLAQLYGITITDLMEDRTIMKTKINPYAVFGSIILNLFIFSAVGATVIAIVISLWIVDLAFVISPFVYLGVTAVGAQVFSWPELGLGLLLLVGGIATFPLIKLATRYIWKATRAYVRYMVSSTTYSTTLVQDSQPTSQPQ
ncbi:MAG: helix-turn-helix domain-containing protein [Bifidobacteriaceae bacterium]|jgi:transcriptional regulator with XRE-family HTH domain|nr:helix-turn-helix domain-containing protein [Bifidobacteriaceae bacterium]MCI1915254.1 helix-turn-helix domain-containing protein [Bifidobacteriaceae bacterium]